MVISEWKELLWKKIIKPNPNHISMNFNEEFNKNCFELKKYYSWRMSILLKNLNKLIKYRKEKINNENQYQ